MRERARERERMIVLKEKKKYEEIERLNTKKEDEEGRLLYASFCSLHPPVYKYILIVLAF